MTNSADIPCQTLDSLPPGQETVIARVHWEALPENEAKRLKAMGVFEGQAVCVLHRGVLFGRDPIAVQIGRTTIALRRMHARNIHLTDTKSTAPLQDAAE